jgi:XTP/dITP diphosphohydrolase
MRIGDAAPFRLLIATTNTNKVREIEPVLRGLDVQLLTLADLPPIAEPEELASTFWENARHKAFAYAAASGVMTVAEDSGLEIAALNGAPGIHSARFLGAGVPYETRFAEIYRRLSTLTNASREARFVTALAVADGTELLFETEARIDGEIATAPAGSEGFGYDPIFWYPPLQKTTGAMLLQEKTAVSHRARAFRDFSRWLTAARAEARGRTEIRTFGHAPASDPAR